MTPPQPRKVGELDTVESLRQSCWEARAILGFDNDGAPTPAALTHPTMAELVKRDAVEFRKDYDEACEEAANLRGELEALRVDAERYRWLRDNSDRITRTSDFHPEGYVKFTTKGGTFDTLDAAIDAALNAARDQL